MCGGGSRTLNQRMRRRLPTHRRSYLEHLSLSLGCPVMMNSLPPARFAVCHGMTKHESALVSAQDGTRGSDLVYLAVSTRLYGIAGRLPLHLTLPPEDRLTGADRDGTGRET